MNQLSLNRISSAHALFPYKIVVVTLQTFPTLPSPAFRVVLVRPESYSPPLSNACHAGYQFCRTYKCFFITQIFYFYWVDKIKCSYNSDSVELVKSSLKCLEAKGKFCALSPAINTENSLTHQKMSANLLTRLPSFFINPKSYKMYLGSLVSCSFDLLNCASSSSLVLVLHGSPYTSATIFFFPSISKSANLCVLLILISLNKPLISA